MRGHQVHFISTETPFRLGEFQAGLSFHQVLTPTYPLFREPQYLLSLSNKIVQVAREFSLDIIHAHYAVPHATAAFLSRAGAGAQRRQGAARRDDAARHRHHARRQRSVVLGDRRVLDRSVRPRDRGVEEPARRRPTTSSGVKRDIEVIPNFLDCGIHRRQNVRRCGSASPATTRREDRDARFELPAGQAHRRRDGGLRSHPAAGAGAAAARRRRSRAARGLPPGPRARHRRISCTRVGAQEEVVPLLSISDLFLLPSAQESFGLAALEAMACEVPVVASRVGGAARSDRARRERVPASARGARRDGRERRHAADRPGTAQGHRRGRLPRVREDVLRRDRSFRCTRRATSGCCRRLSASWS